MGIYEVTSAHSASKDPNVLFEPDPLRKESWVYNKKLPALGAFFGGGPFLLTNFMTRLPLWAGAWRMIVGAGVGATAGYYYSNWRQVRLSEYDALLRWYIAEHPEEFVVPERKKVGELMGTWTPVR